MCALACSRIACVHENKGIKAGVARRLSWRRADDALAIGLPRDDHEQATGCKHGAIR
ncbi:hypothetical protein PENSPDRAFT_659921 [Peniophora sp. CONT]|nr:hypothetical protein PENSPDRAFT_659921 [Peniophora sp. CONT]